MRYGYDDLRNKDEKLAAVYSISAWIKNVKS